MARSGRKWRQRHLGKACGEIVAKAAAALAMAYR